MVSLFASAAPVGGPKEALVKVRMSFRNAALYRVNKRRERFWEETPPPDPSEPVYVSDELLVWSDGRRISSLPAELIIEDDDDDALK